MQHPMEIEAAHHFISPIRNYVQVVDFLKKSVFAYQSDAAWWPLLWGLNNCHVGGYDILGG